MRVLLLEQFQSCRIEGAEQGFTMRVELKGSDLRLSRMPVSSVESKGGEPKVIAEAASFRFRPQEGEVLQLDGIAVRGDLHLFVNKNGEALAVNLIGLEDYLCSVVPTELNPKQFPFLEALKAQAVAARTFAVSERSRRAALDFDVYADHRSQVYRGIAAESELSNRAVAATASVIASYAGQPVAAFYSSTCGGTTESFECIFEGGPIPYLKGGVDCPDDDSPYHRWDEWIDVRRIQGELDRYAGVGRLKGLNPSKRSDAGRVVEMEFSGDLGVKLLRGNNLRFALALRSNFIDELTPVLDDSGFVRQVHVRGRGWGHGVGLCQYGSVALAKQGLTFDRILKHYYSGIDVNAY